MLAAMTLTAVIYIVIVYRVFCPIFVYVFRSKSRSHNMSGEKKKTYQIDLVYTSAEATTAEMTALHDELARRGHSVCLKSHASQTHLMEDISQTAKDLAQTARDVAETATQKMLDILDPIVPKAASSVTGKKESQAPAKAPFDAIGPSAIKDDNRAIVVTNFSALKDVTWDTYRIGLLPHTELIQAWTPAQLDAMVTPHVSFRPYLESVHWSSDRIFEGGWLSLVKSSAPRETLLKQFGISPEQGPCLLIMSSAFNASDLQTIMLQLSTLRTPFQPFFYYGEASQTAEKLRSLACQFGINARMFGKNATLADYLAIADLALVSPADADFSKLEPLAVPTIIVSDQTPNALAQFLIHNGAAHAVRHTYELAAQLAALLDQPQLLENLKTAAGKIADTASVTLCADAIEKALSAKSTLRPRTPAPLTENTGFETIGIQTQPAPQNTSHIPMTSMQPVQPTLTPVQSQASQTSAPLQPMFGKTPTSYKEAHKEYTQLLLVERDLDRSLDAASGEVRKWEERLDLARQHQNEKLINEAMLRLKSAQATEMALFRQKDEISQRKSILKKSAQQLKNGLIPSNPLMDDDFDAPLEDSLEQEFKALQRKQQIQNLKNKMGLR